MDVHNPKEIIHPMISPQAYFPGNRHYPLLIYKQVFAGMNASPTAIQTLLHENHWTHSWTAGIYDFHHYHSNTHEVLVITSGECRVQFGGETGLIYIVHAGDVIIIPVGVAHKSLLSSNSFQCIGAYPFEEGPDMNYGTETEYSKASETISRIGLPKKDPIFGKNGLLFKYWVSPN